ncbi:methyltransferase domain-containing protein [bacterium]|nr:methyltransferase domain-containing protein [bacterium]
MGVGLDRGGACPRVPPPCSEVSGLNDSVENAPWWASYFSANYGALYKGPLAEELATDDEVETLARVFRGAKAPVLDIGCGYGRHLAGMRSAGINAIGLDFSAALLPLIPARHRKFAVRGDMRHLPFATGSLGGATLLFNTFGYFDDDANAAILAEVARVLQPGAPLVMDLPCRSGMKAVVEDVPAAISHRGRVSIYESWFISDDGQRLLGKGSWDIKGEHQEWELALRLYSPTELTRLLRRAGFSTAIEIRPLEDFSLLGTDEEPAPTGTDSIWRRTSNMCALAIR